VTKIGDFRKFPTSSKTSEDTGSNPVRGILYSVKNRGGKNEKKFKTLEEEGPDEMEMAEKKDEKREEKKA
jgi:hypothetical protein